MKSKFKTFGMLAVALLTAGALQADGMMGYNNYGSGCGMMGGCCPTACCETGRMDTHTGVVGVYSESSTECCPIPKPCYGYAYNPPIFFADCCGWSANIEYLYLKPFQHGISPGSIETIDSADNFVSSGVDTFVGEFHGTRQYPKFDWDSGFRLGVGYTGPCDGWKALLQYTHFRTDACYSGTASFTQPTGTTSKGFGTVFVPAYTLLNGITGFADTNDFSADWHIQWNQLDLDFGREFIVGRTVTLRPFVGLRALFMETKYELKNEGVAGTDGDLKAVAFSEDFHFDNSFKGVGLKAGLGSSYAIGCGLSIYGDITGALVYGHYNVKQRGLSKFENGQSGTNIAVEKVFLKEDNSFHSLLGAGDLSLGVQWRDLFNCDKSVFTLKFGWEHHVFFDLNQFRGFPFAGDWASFNADGGDLNLYGFVFSATIDF